MARWRVTCLGYETGTEYVYEVTEKADAKHHVVAADAFQQHARLKLRGGVTEYLQAHPKVELIGWRST